ncbi:MAG: Rab family GTPase [Candidatus Hodarchaeota archaeon]
MDNLLKEPLTILFQNFLKAVPDATELHAIDMIEKNAFVSAGSIGGGASSIERLTPFVETAMSRMANESMVKKGQSSFLDTNENRLIFIKVEELLLCFVLDIEARIDDIVPYAYILADKVNFLAQGETINLNIPAVSSSSRAGGLFDYKQYLDLLSSDTRYNVKLIFIGDAAVGKTSLINRYATKTFKENFLPTLGVSITSNKVELPNSRVTVQFSTWDMGGQENFKRVRSKYYSGARACFMVFDLAERSSFENLVNWEKEKDQFAGKIITIVLGNKNDLTRGVSRQEAEDFANQHGYTYVETSALTGNNVPESFQLLAFKILNSDLETQRESI